MTSTSTQDEKRAAHTPGPWHTGLARKWHVDVDARDVSTSSMHVLGDGNSDPIAIACASLDNEERCAALAANARLIAQAPTLLELLKRTTLLLSAARLAMSDSECRVIASEVVEQARAAIAAATKGAA